MLAHEIDLPWQHRSRSVLSCGGSKSIGELMPAYQKDRVDFLLVVRVQALRLVVLALGDIREQKSLCITSSVVALTFLPHIKVYRNFKN